ncbi:MAG: penicillin-binding protein activator [Casimicrobium sp.]
MLISTMPVGAQTLAPSVTAADLPRTLAYAPDSKPQPLRVVVLLPLENPQLRRAASIVRDGMAAVFATRKSEIRVVDCAYGVAGVVQAYVRCVTPDTDWVVGPLGRTDVTALALAKLEMPKPTLMLSPLGSVPPEPMTVLSPDLESEAEAVAQQASDDACRKPLLIEAADAMSSRVSVAITAYWRERSVTPLPAISLPSRNGWRRAADQWRNDNVDCVLFAGGGAVLTELRPYLRSMAVYVTSASFETSLDRTVDWTGIRIADAPWIVDAERAEFAQYLPAAALAPTLARLYALGVDASRLVIAAGRDSLPVSFDGAIGQLTLKDGQYRRQPVIGEFRERTLVKVGP